MCRVIHQFSANAHHFSAENAINAAQDFYRIQKPCSLIERKYFGELPVKIPVFALNEPYDTYLWFKVSLKAHLVTFKISRWVLS